jgi:predicted nucleotidyltransferase
MKTGIITLMTAQELDLPISLAELQTILRKHGVAKAQIFGSFARGEATSRSDLDLLVTLESGRTYLDLGGLQYELELRLERRVDIATKLNHHFEPYVKPDLTTLM